MSLLVLSSPGTAAIADRARRAGLSRRRHRIASRRQQIVETHGFVSQLLFFRAKTQLCDSDALRSAYFLTGESHGSLLACGRGRTRSPTRDKITPGVSRRGLFGARQSTCVCRWDYAGPNAAL